MTVDIETPQVGFPAGERMLGASRIRAEAKSWRDGRPVTGALSHALAVEASAREQLPERLAKVGAGGELVPNVSKHGLPAEFRSTIQDPDYVTACASRERLDLANEAGALEVALDAADTICAQNSIEQMLAHQIAAAHCSALKMVAQMNKQIECMNVLKDERRQAANVEATRLAGAVSRLMLTSQQGALTLQRLKTGGRQVVTVQHVNVGHGGQAIVAGQVSGGGSVATPTGRGEGVKNGQ